LSASCDTDVIVRQLIIKRYKSLLHITVKYGIKYIQNVSRLKKMEAIPAGKPPSLKE
jgi:hypothetical protein